MSAGDQSAARLNAVWGWSGLEAADVLGFGYFGDVLVVANDGSGWAVCPAETRAHQVTTDLEAIKGLRALVNPNAGIFGEALIAELKETLGPLGADQIYAMQYPASVGGKIEAANFRVESSGTITSA